VKWFKHDSCANRDEKLEKVLLKYGADGYALYWLCLELIADRIDAANVQFELKHDAETLGARLKIDTLRVEEIMKFFIKIELFECENARITCLKLAERIENSIVKSIEVKKIQEKIRDNPGKSGKNPDNSGQRRLEERRRDKKANTDSTSLSSSEKSSRGEEAGLRRLGFGGLGVEGGDDIWLLGEGLGVGLGVFGLALEGELEGVGEEGGTSVLGGIS